ncbi:MAG: hypothetical protein GEU86_12195 [Actinophytocola sp.]|nr:hypothetical protein [Actinophytocola sp.]
MSQPLFDPYIYRALREVARGEISRHRATAELWHRDQVMPPRCADALLGLYDGGYIHWCDDVPGGLLRADLTRAGAQLLASWLSVPRDQATAA